MFDCRAWTWNSHGSNPTTQNQLVHWRVSTDESPTWIFSLMVSLSAFINEYAMQWIRGRPAQLGLYCASIVRYGISSVHHHLIIPSPPTTPFSMIRLIPPFWIRDSLRNRRYGEWSQTRNRNRSMDVSTKEGNNNDLDRRVIASSLMRESSCDHRARQRFTISNKWLDDDKFSGVKFFALTSSPSVHQKEFLLKIKRHYSIMLTIATTDLIHHHHHPWLPWSSSWLPLATKDNVAAWCEHVVYVELLDWHNTEWLSEIILINIVWN